MFYIKKIITISAAHDLSFLPYESNCKRLHGHNWTITIYCRSKQLNGNGMVVDFSYLGKLVKDKLDHRFLNDVGIRLPTAENIALWICEEINDKKMKSGWNNKEKVLCYRVDVKETEGNEVTYEV